MSLFQVVTVNEDRTLLTESEAREAIRNSIADVNDLINRVSAAIVRDCKVRAAAAVPPTLRSEAVSDTFRLKSAQPVLVLSRRPVTLISSVVENGETLDAADYEVSGDSGLLRRLSSDVETCWPACKIVVSYTAGWATVPEDLKLAAMKLAGVLHSEGERVDPNLKRVSIPGVEDREYWVAPSSDTLIPQEVMDLLTPYRNIFIG